MSHITLIVVLSLVFYVYWNRAEIWPDKVSDKKMMDVSADRQIDNKKPAEIIVSTVSGSEENSKLETIPVIQNSSNSGVSDSFTERMNQYKKTLSVEQQKTMDEAALTFKHISDDTVNYHVESSELVESSETAAVVPNSLTSGKNDSIEKNIVETQSVSLQQQIRNRQKQLQSQMVMLIPFDPEKDKQSSKNVKKPHDIKEEL